jgi:8-oxo-dGTP diphosphatase
MSAEIKVDLYTMCIVQDGDRILLLNRPNKRGFPGYIGPGGKIDFPESLTDGAIREVWEETGLKVTKLVYKGLDEYVNPALNYRYMVFNYLATEFEGKLLDHPPEGELHWVTLEDAMDLPMQPWFRRRLPLFFEEGTFEIYVVWDEENNVALRETVKKI